MNNWIISYKYDHPGKERGIVMKIGEIISLLSGLGDVLGWQAFDVSNNGCTRSVVHLLLETRLDRRKCRDKLLDPFFLMMTGWCEPLHARDFRIGEGNFQMRGTFEPNASNLQFIKPHLHLLAKDEILPKTMNLIRGTAASVILQDKPNISPESYKKLKSGYAGWSLKAIS
jgi:hypothetical protein